MCALPSHLLDTPVAKRITNHRLTTAGSCRSSRCARVCVCGGTSVIPNVGLQLAGTFWDFISRCNHREIQFSHIRKSVGLNPASEGI